jgi:hypothetical protein
MTGVQAVAVDASARAGTASAAATRQTASLDGLSATSRQLAELSDRLRHSISRFSVAAPQATEPPAHVVTASALPSPEEPSAAAALAAR